MYMESGSKGDLRSKTSHVSKALRMDKKNPVRFRDDDDDDQRKLERARKISLRKQDLQEGPRFGLLAGIVNSVDSTPAAEENEKLLSTSRKESKQEENKKLVILTEMEEFALRNQLDEESHKGEEDVFLAPTQQPKEEEDDENIVREEDPAVPDEKFFFTIHEIPIGKGLSGTLNLLKQRGDLKEVETVDKKQKRKLLDGHEKEIVIERRDANGRILTDPKEAFRVLCHNFHGKFPGKKKQEKKMRQEELKRKLIINQMENPSSSLSVERMRNAHAQLKSSYLVISGNIKPGQTSDPRNKFGLMYSQNAHSPKQNLTPMLGDRKVEHSKRKPDVRGMGPPKRPKFGK